MTGPRAVEVVVGTGGIGTGMFLALEGDHTLGREESRAATLLDQHDWCKLHIVCHYVRRLLGPAVPVVPIGQVGDDAPGREAVAAMRTEGIDTSLVGIAERPTLFSVCFLYPGGDGGNITTTGSASDGVTPADVDAAAPLLAAHRGRGIAVALPEVPLATRAALLRAATAASFRRFATFVSAEWPDVVRGGLLREVDLLAVNLDEAAALLAATETSTPAGGTAADRAATGGTGQVHGGEAEPVVRALVGRLCAAYPDLSLVVTAGRSGSWAWDGTRLSHAAALPVPVASTAGAGDAHLAALVVATALGQPLAEANRYAALVSGLKVTSPHTINPDITAALVRQTAAAAGTPLPEVLAALPLTRVPTGTAARP